MAEIRRGKKNKRQDENIMVCPIPLSGHKYYGVESRTTIPLFIIVEIKTELDKKLVRR